MLQQAAHDLFGLTLSLEQVTMFETYARELAIWNDRMNLTAILEPEAINVRHFLDSLSVAKAINLQAGMHIMDVGTGAGFPGLPLHIAVAGLTTTLMEATGKKLLFLDHMIQTLGLQKIKTLHARAEDAGHIAHHRGSYDGVVARAVARLPVLAEYLLPFARVGGYCVAMKGETAMQEAEDAQKALELLGGKLVKIEQIELPEVAEKHYLVVVEKVSKTPPAYPRKPGIPSKKPLS